MRGQKVSESPLQIVLVRIGPTAKSLAGLPQPARAVLSVQRPSRSHDRNSRQGQRHETRGRSPGARTRVSPRRPALMSACWPTMGTANHQRPVQPGKKMRNMPDQHREERHDGQSRVCLFHRAAGRGCRKVERGAQQRKRHEAEDNPEQENARQAGWA